MSFLLHGISTGKASIGIYFLSIAFALFCGALTGIEKEIMRNSRFIEGTYTVWRALLGKFAGV